MRILQILKSSRGFTLIEILVSLAIFGMMMVAFLSLFSSALYMTIRSGNRDKAVADAAGQVESKIVEPAAAAENAQVVITFPDAAPAQSYTIKQYSATTTHNGMPATVDYYKP